MSTMNVYYVDSDNLLMVAAAIGMAFDRSGAYGHEGA